MHLLAGVDPPTLHPTVIAVKEGAVRLATQPIVNVSNDAAKAVNKRLIKYCNQNAWRMIKHQNIDRNCLNKSGLHLNEKGNNIFFRNFVNALDNSSMY